MRLCLRIFNLAVVRKKVTCDIVISPTNPSCCAEIRSVGLICAQIRANSVKHTQEVKFELHGIKYYSVERYLANAFLIKYAFIFRVQI